MPARSCRKSSAKPCRERSRNIRLLWFLPAIPAAVSRMKTPPSLLPDPATLASRLAAALYGDGAAGRLVTILERKLPRMMSTFPNEIVTCRLPDGRTQRVFAKYEAGHSHNSFGHRGNVRYEAEVYCRVLKALPGFRPRFLGMHGDALTGDTSLFLEYAYRSVRVSDISVKQTIRQPRAITQAARWLAQFHVWHESRAGDPALAFLKRYDADYYRGWAKRTFEFAHPLRQDLPWLAELRARGDSWFAPLLVTAPTVIHGEFYAKTVLLRGENLFMVDWESTAIAAGEIDLAALTEGKGWPADIVRRCEREYCRVRWPKGTPAQFQQTLDAARIYLHFRWLGERPDWTLREKSFWRYGALRAAAERLGLLSGDRNARGGAVGGRGPGLIRSAAQRSGRGGRLCARDNNRRKSPRPR